MTHQKTDTNWNKKLHMSISNSDLSGVKTAVKHGADLTKRNMYGSPPLVSASFNGQKEIVQYLLTTGIDINQQNSGGQTALSYAVSQDHFDIVVLLIESGADINRSCMNDYTPLMQSMICKNETCIDYLIAQGACLLYTSPSPRDRG